MECNDKSAKFCWEPEAVGNQTAQAQAPCTVSSPKESSQNFWSWSIDLFHQWETHFLMKTALDRFAPSGGGEQHQPCKQNSLLHCDADFKDRQKKTVIFT